jgi:hypothetical protein
VEVNCAASSSIQPFVDGARKRWTIALIEFRQPDEHIGSFEEPAEREQLFVGPDICVFGKDHTRDVRA